MWNKAVGPYGRPLCICGESARLFGETVFMEFAVEVIAVWELCVVNEGLATGRACVGIDYEPTALRVDVA